MFAKSFVSIFSISLTLCLAACSKKTATGTSIPAIEPPVKAATPSALSSTLFQNLFSARNPFSGGLDVSEIQSRFFSGAGPTDVSTLLKSIDSRMAEINSRSTEGTRACLSATPVSDSITVLGETVEAKFQCYDVFSDSSGGMMFGKDGDTWYLYQNGGAMRSLVKITPEAASSSDYTVDAWMSVGQSNSPEWYSMSYGVIRLRASSSSKDFEMTVAGSGFGYASAHLISDESNLYVVGEASGGTTDGTTWNVDAIDNKCLDASSSSTVSTSCDTINNGDLSLATLGVSGQSTFASGAGLLMIDGTDADAVHFGRSVEELSTLTGVSAF